MSEPNRELILQLLDDAGILSRLSSAPRVSPAECRALLIPPLRRWVADGQFYLVQKLLRPHAVKFPLRLSPKAVERCREGAIEHWMGFVEVEQIGIGMILPRRKFISSDGSNNLDLADPKGTLSQMSASAFFDQPMFYWRDKFYSRMQILKVHANKLGGVHFDPRRADEDAYIDELVQFFGLEIVGSNLQMLIGPDIPLAKADPLRRARTYDAMEIVALDTARIFAAGIGASRSQIEGLL